ncbi:hypothetical protein BG011_005460 [Mortierella polycephala]|uniref:Uncharacterized protein n=1 Tax=Mortierella polycephala TaxID=41804 RepID=A0A9P6U0A0_9FUNG|nr:hypothetical protein BG011_005460 [Mortierella polycephala]
MDKDKDSRQVQSDLNQRWSQQQQESQATARKQQQEQGQRDSEQTSESQPPETPSGQSKIEAPMSGKKMCGHKHDCDCSTETAIHASEEHAPTN